MCPQQFAYTLFNAAESFRSCHLGKGLEKSIPVGMLLSASGLGIDFPFFFFFLKQRFPTKSTAL